MNTSPNTHPQERLLGAIGALLFFVPFFMDRTEFSVFYMRQGFLLFVGQFLLAILSVFMPVAILFLFTLMHFILALVALFLAWKAYSGEKFAFPQLYEMSLSLIKALNMEKLFSPNK